MVQMAKSSPMKNSSKPHARKVSTSQPNTKKAGRKNLDPDETPHYVASHLDPNCLQKPSKFGSSTERVKSDRKTESKDDEDFEMEAEEEEEEVVATTKQGELQRECKLCSKIYSSVYLLRHHVENVHSKTKPRPFQCELCDYAAINKWNLKEHYCRHTVDNFMDEDVPNESQEKDEDSDFVMSASEEEEYSGSDREEEIKSASTEKSEPQGSRRLSCTVGKRKRYKDSDKDLESLEDDYVPYNYVSCKRVPKTKRPKKASVLEEEDEELEEEEEELTPKKKRGRGKAEKEEESSDEDDVDGDDGDDDKSSGKGRDKVEKVRQLKSKHRPPCMCGKKCYRKDPFHSAIFHMNFGKNPEHFAEFSHPGDSSYDEQSDLEDDNIPDCWVRMTRIQESPLLATSIQYQRRELHRKCKIMGGDTESESVPLKDSTTQTDVNSTAARVGTETLNLNQTPDEFNSVCVKIDTDEWDNMATDFYSKCAKSEQVLREEMHQDNNKLNGFNLVHEQSEKTGCLEMVQDSTRQDGFPSACVDSEQMGCDVTHQNVTRQAGSNPDRVHSKQIDDSNTYTAENGLHSAGVKTTQMDHDCNHNVPMDSNYEKDEPVLQLNSQWKSISVGQIGLSPLSSQPQYYLLQEPQMVTMVTTAQTRQCLATAAPVFDEIQDAGDEILDEHKLSTSVVQVLPMSSNPSESQDDDVSLPMSSAICNMAEVSMTAEEVTSNLVEESGECSSDDFEEIFIETCEKNKKTSKIYQSTLSALKRVRAQGSSRGVDKPTGASVREDLEDEGHDYHSNPEGHVCMKCQAEFLDQDKLIIHQKDCLKPVMLLFDDHSMKSENQSDHCHLNGYNSQKQASGNHTEEQEVDDSSSMNQSNEYSSCKAADEVDTADKHINFEIPNSDGKESDYNKSLDEEGEDNEYQRPRKLDLSEKIKANPTAADIAAHMLQLSSLEPTMGTSASSNVVLEPIEANKAAVAQFADNNPDQEKDVGKLQAALFNLQQQQLMQLQMIHQLQQQLVNSGGPTEQFPTTLLNGQFGSSFPGLNLSMAALQRAAAGERTRSSQSSSEHDSQSPDSDSDSGNEEKEKSQPYTPPIMSRTHSPSYTPITEQDPGNTEHEVSPMSLLMMAASKAGGLASSSASSAGQLDFSRSSKVNAAKRTAPLFLKPCWVKLDKKVDLVSEKCGNRILKAFANRLDPDETPQNMVSHQDPNCLLF